MGAGVLGRIFRSYQNPPNNPTDTHQTSLPTPKKTLPKPPQKTIKTRQKPCRNHKRAHQNPPRKPYRNHKNNPTDTSPRTSRILGLRGVLYSVGGTGDRNSRSPPCGAYGSSLSYSKNGSSKSLVLKSFFWSPVHFGICLYSKNRKRGRQTGVRQSSPYRQYKPDTEIQYRPPMPPKPMGLN